MLIKFFLSLIQMVLILRFHLEISKINAFTEPVNTIRKITNPVVLPVKQLISVPQLKKFSALIVAYLLTVVMAIVLTRGASIPKTLLYSVIIIVDNWLTLLKYGLFFYVIGSWIQLPVMQRINYLLHSLFEPLLSPIRRVLPPFSGLDFSPIVLWFLMAAVEKGISSLILSLLTA